MNLNFEPAEQILLQMMMGIAPGAQVCAQLRAALAGIAAAGRQPGQAGLAVSRGQTSGHQPPASNALPITEVRNPATADIDTLETLEMVRRMNREDQQVAMAVERELSAIAQAIDAITARMQTGGRLIYLGAGTSGRLGVLDASECPPTFNTPPGLVIGLIAGGEQALTNAVEGAEDDRDAAGHDLEQIQLTALDSVVGIAASGGTPYVQAGLEAARQRGALTISLVCALPAAIEQFAEIKIRPLVGPEVIAGSTRLKAGSAQKMVLNMISTGVMVCLGKTFGNLMVDVQLTNSKLRQRAQRIVAEAAGLSLEQAGEILNTCGSETKTAIVASLAGVPPAEARRRLAEHGGVVRKALELKISSLRKTNP